jgi:transposase
VSMTGNNGKGEVLHGPERRRRWAAAEKIAIVAETYEPGVTVSLVVRRHGVADGKQVGRRVGTRPQRRG